MQLMARKALVDGLVRYDEAHGWHGAIEDDRPRPGLGRAAGRHSGLRRHQALAARRRARRRPTRSIRIGLQPDRDKAGAVVAGARDRHGDRRTATAGPAGAPKTLVKPGDVFYVEPMAGKAGEYRLRQIPGGQRRLRGDGPVHRPRAGDGRRLLLRPVRVQPRDPGAAPARLVVQAASSTPRRSTTAIRRPRIMLDEPVADRPGQRRDLEAAELRRQVRRHRTRCASASSIRSTR